MATDVVMPQMGESIFEGTITKWLKKPGDKVQRDEPLFEISTDKVDAEIPAPAAGVLKEIKVKEGATVQVNTVVGVIDADGSGAAAAPPQPTRSQTKPAPAQSAPAEATPQADGGAQQPPATEKSAPVKAEKISASTGSNGGAGIDVVMPQMGESIFEGTITKWLKKVGDKVQRDEPLFEISTDKVDAEIPAPAAGVLREIKVQEGATVQVNSVVGVIGGAGGRRKLLQQSHNLLRLSQRSRSLPSRRLHNRNPRNNSKRSSRSRSLVSRHLVVERMASVCARHRWFAVWRVKTMWISTKFPAQAWADGSARRIFKILSSSMAKGAADRRW